MGICLPARILQVNPPPLFSSHILPCSCPDIIIFFIIIVVLHYLRIEPQVQVCFSWSFFFKDFEDHKFSSAEGASGGSCDDIWGLCPGDLQTKIPWTLLYRPPPSSFSWDKCMQSTATMRNPKSIKLLRLNFLSLFLSFSSFSQWTTAGPILLWHHYTATLISYPQDTCNIHQIMNHKRQDRLELTWFLPLCHSS